LAFSLGQPFSDEDSDTFDDLIDPMIEELIARDIIFIEDVDAIEDKYFIALAHLLAGRASSAFGVLGTSEAQEVAARAEKAELDLKEMDRKSVRYIHERVMRTDYPQRVMIPSST
jgi:hypothetical protein